MKRCVSLGRILLADEDEDEDIRGGGENEVRSGKPGRKDQASALLVQQHNIVISNTSDKRSVAGTAFMVFLR